MILLALLIQTTPVAPIVKGTALPPPASEEGQVMAPITTLLGALERSDPAAILSVTLPEGAVTAARTGPDGRPQHRTVKWSDFAAGLKPERGRIDERIGTPAIEIDGDVAMVWAPYSVAVDGRLSHCGYNHFDMVRTGEGWRILNVTYSHRTTGCAIADPAR